jgi:hemoglobin
MTLYEKYGGFSTIHSIVKNFYRDVLAEESLAPYFKNVSMDFLIQHQSDFLSQILGGPVQYKGRTLRQAHQRLHIKRADFDLVAQLLKENLEDAGVEQADIESILEIVASTLPDIVFND